jgi:scyllo-inositol 2-dehydrogenase (NADP+)
LRYVVVGLGNIGRKRRDLLGSRCAATVDPYAADADYATLAECPPTTYEAVVVAVPNQAKLTLVEQAIRHRKHVLVEKPLPVDDEAAADRLHALAEAHGVRCYTAYNHRFEPLIVQLRGLLAAGAIGTLYQARLFYGNGTVGHVTGSWRDDGLGVLEDLGSHLLDLSAYMFGDRHERFAACALDTHEASTYDHCTLVSIEQEPRLILEVSYLSWKNTFTVDLLGRRGSLHVRGLPKWGESELVLRERMHPSGVPRERRWTVSGPDVTWRHDLEHFESLCLAGPGSSAQHDWWIARTLRDASTQQPNLARATMAGAA